MTRTMYTWRSIPAHAGEPCVQRLDTWRSDGRVYPRPRGGADSPQVCVHAVAGRGSIPAHAGEPCEITRLRFSLRSIPAHAGEPSRDAHGSHQPARPGLSPPTRGSRDRAQCPASCRRGGLPRVYPRPRGGARPSEAGEVAVATGSIPAHAGEPRASAPVTVELRRSIPAHAGESSPRLLTDLPLPRSIPAHAGEPDVPRDLAHAGEPEGANRGVYPRPRGGALRNCSRLPRADGSIPAHAGEPHALSLHWQG